MANNLTQDILKEFATRLSFNSHVYKGSHIVDMSVAINIFQELMEASLERVRRETKEEDLKEKLSILPRKFWEDEDHAVGGYISKKDLYELLKEEKTT